MRRTLTIVSLLMLLGCASSPVNLQRETARVIGQQVSPSSVTVSNVDRGWRSVSWTATAGGRSYQCSADDMVKRPYCVEGGR
jgi:hypothetical protein